jgi:hypothetical protein
MWLRAEFLKDMTLIAPWRISLVRIPVLRKEHDEIQEFQTKPVCFGLTEIIRPVSIIPFNEFLVRENANPPPTTRMLGFFMLLWTEQGKSNVGRCVYTVYQ